MTGTGSKPLVVVLGASGLLGTAITRQLAARPVRLRVVARRPTSVPAGCRAEVEVRTADLTVPGEFTSAVAGADAVVHLVMYADGAGGWRAAEHDRVAERVNVGLVHDLVEAVRAGNLTPRPVVVFAGSVKSHEPLTGYDRQKLAAEDILAKATAEGTLRGVTLRLSTLFGQGTDPAVHDRSVVATMMRRALAGQPLTMWHDGAIRRDLLCVDDAALAFLAAMDCADALAGRPWPVGAGHATSVADLFETIVRVVSAFTGTPPVPVVSVAPPSEYLATDLVDLLCDPSAFRDATGWSARVPLHEALERLVSSLEAAR
jgi:dTDP-4-keto-6-deoxyhexose 4-ketoreductase